MGLTTSIPNAIGDKMKSAQAEMMKTQMARQLALQNEMRQKQIAMQLAIGKERLFVRKIINFRKIWTMFYFSSKFRFLNNFFIFHRNFDFWTFIFNRHFDFWRNFLFLTENSIFDDNFYF